MTEPTTEAGLNDADKLRVLAAWFDMWDRPETDRQAVLDDPRNPGRNDVQRDLLRIAAVIEAEARASLDVDAYLDSISVMTAAKLRDKWPVSAGVIEAEARADDAHRMAVDTMRVHDDAYKEGRAAERKRFDDEAYQRGFDNGHAEARAALDVDVLALRTAAQAVCVAWFDRVETDVDPAMRQALVDLRAILAEKQP